VGKGATQSSLGSRARGTHKRRGWGPPQDCYQKNGLVGRMGKGKNSAKKGETGERGAKEGGLHAQGLSHVRGNCFVWRDCSGEKRKETEQKRKKKITLT